MHSIIGENPRRQRVRPGPGAEPFAERGGWRGQGLGQGQGWRLAHASPASDEVSHRCRAGRPIATVVEMPGFGQQRHHRRVVGHQAGTQRQDLVFGRIDQLPSARRCSSTCIVFSRAAISVVRRTAAARWAATRLSRRDRLAALASMTGCYRSPLPTMRGLGHRQGHRCLRRGAWRPRR
jgi:hypothetical protein